MGRRREWRDMCGAMCLVCKFKKLRRGVSGLFSIRHVGASLTDRRPHASNTTSFQWKDVALDCVCSATGINKSQITQLRGNSKLDSWNSVMHYDRPSELVSSPVSYRDRVANVDSDTLKVLNQFYPTPREFEVVEQACSNMPGWKETWTEQKLLEREHSMKWSGGEKIPALSYVNLGTNGDYQASAYTNLASNPKATTIVMGANRANTHVVNIIANFLLWNAPDWGIQSGCVDSSDIRGEFWTKTRGDQYEKRITFGHSFKSTPKVSTFIYRFYVEKGNWIRVSVFPKDVSNTGFTMCLHSWAGKSPTFSMYSIINLRHD
jgi:hypothetical protein